MVQKQRIIDQFMELVRVDSETRHEELIAKALKEKFGALGLQVEEDDSKERSQCGSGNLLFTLAATPGKEQAPTLFFTCHMDTVVPGKGIKSQLGDDGYIRSDGTTVLGSDDKAGIAAMLETILVIQENKLEHGTLKFVITAGEETSLSGSRAMKPGWFEADFGYAIDSNGSVGGIAVAAPSNAKVYMTFIGKSAHAGVNPEDGVSAITVASKAVSRMPLGRIDKETTANIGSFAGGGETNIVCEHVKLIGEARSIVQEKLTKQLAAMQEACESAAAEMNAQVDFKSIVFYPAYKFDETAPLVQLAMKAIEKAGRTPKTFHSGGGSDANIFNGLGIPTVNLSVGYQEIHTTNEHIHVSELVKIAEVVVEIVKEAAQLSK